MSLLVEDVERRETYNRYNTYIQHHVAALDKLECHSQKKVHSAYSKLHICPSCQVHSVQLGNRELKVCKVSGMILKRVMNLISRKEKTMTSSSPTLETQRHWQRTCLPTTTCST